MRPVHTLAFAIALLLGLHQAQAQTSPASPPPGAADPTRSPPAQLVPPPRTLIPPAQPAPATPAAATPAPEAAPSTPSALVPEDTGLCQCLHRAGSTQPQPDETRLELQCLTGVAQCTAACQTTTNYSFVPHASLSCPTGPQGVAGHVAMNRRPATRLLSAR
jgi:hypothetical protein